MKFLNGLKFLLAVYPGDVQGVQNKFPHILDRFKQSCGAGAGVGAGAARSRPFWLEPEPKKITKFRLRLRLLVNCRAEKYEFVTTKKKNSSLIQKVVPKVENVNSE